MSATAQSRDARCERRNGWIYLTGLGFSLVGNSALSLAAGIWVKSLTGSSGAAGLVSACVYLPSLLGPLGGLLADRVRQRRLLIALDLVSAVVVLALLLVRSRAQVWLIFVVMLWYGTALMLAGPAESALFARMFTADTRARMNGRSLALQEFGRLVSPLVGAGLFASAGGGVVALVDALTFVVGAAATTLLRTGDRTPGQDEPTVRTTWRQAVVAGLRLIFGLPGLRAVALLAVVAMFLSGVVGPAQYSLVTALHRPPSFLGVLAALLGAGSVVAGLTAGRVIARLGERTVAGLAVLNLVIGYVLYATGALVPALVGALVLGAALPWSLVALVTAGQRLAPLAAQGQVSAAITLVLFAPLPIAQVLGAALIGRTGFRPLYLGVAFLLVAVTPVLYRVGTGARPVRGIEPR